MRSIELTAVAASLAFISNFSQAQVTTLTQAGYTGLGITPNAHVIDWGRAEFSYDNQLPGVLSNTHGSNYVLGFGLLPNLEIYDRLATNSLSANCFAENCGIRDLSTGAKFGIPLDAAHRFRAAVGATDVGGAATNFRSYYGVFTYSEHAIEASAGLARRRQAPGSLSRSPLSGPFAAAAWQPAPWLRTQVEYTDRNAWAGIRLFAPRGWMPDGWSAFIGTNHRLNNNAYTERSWISAGLSIPLYKIPKTQPHAASDTTRTATLPGEATASMAATAPSGGGARPAAPVESNPATNAPVPSTKLDDTRLQALARALEHRGLDSIWVGRLPNDAVIVRADNGVYRRNSVDALGAALGAVASAIGKAHSAYRLILTQDGIPLVAAAGNADCLRLWVERQEPACIPFGLSTPGTADLDRLQEGAVWSVRNQQPAWQTLRVAISPVLRTHIGTELGALNYSAGANVGLQLPLWAGGRLEWRRDVPVANSSEYDRAGGFGPERIRGETERLALVHITHVPLERWFGTRGHNGSSLGGMSFQGLVGRVGGTFDGVHGALRWEPGEGWHRFTAESGYFRNAAFGTDRPTSFVRNAKPLLVNYRYNFNPTRSYVEASAGQFMYNDRGLQLGLRQWFNDVSVRVYYRRSRFPADPVRQFIGLELAFPIGPRRDARPIPHLQLGGTPRFTVGDETLVRDVNNAVRGGYGVVPPVPSPDATFNLDRAGLVYFENNLGRIRDAAQ